MISCASVCPWQKTVIGHRDTEPLRKTGHEFHELYENTFSTTSVQLSTTVNGPSRGLFTYGHDEKTPAVARHVELPNHRMVH